MVSRTPPVMLAVAIAAVFAFAACDGDDAGDASTSTAPTAIATDAGSTPTQEPTPIPGEQLGGDPIFYTPLDRDFASLRAGESYFIMFRVTNGYAEETLPITATNEAGETVEFEALYAEPVGEGDPPGSYYPFSLELPEGGTWTITVTAGADSATFTVDAAEDESEPGDPQYIP